MGFLDKLVIGMLVFVLVIVVGNLIISDVDNNYDEFNLSTSENDSFNTLNTKANSIVNDLYSDSKSINQKVSGEDGEVEDEDKWESMVKGAYSAVLLIPKSFGLIDATAGVIEGELGINPIFRLLLFTAIVFMVGITLVYLIFRVGK